MSTNVIGIIPPDEAYRNKIAAWRACVVAGVLPPTELRDYFGEDGPDAAGLLREIDADVWRADMQQGFEVDITKLPPDVKIIRFYNSW